MQRIVKIHRLKTVGLQNNKCKGKVKDKVVPVLFSTEHHTMKAYWGIGSLAVRILDLGTIWRRVVSFD